MAKTGRVLDSVELEARLAKRQRRARIRAWIGTAFMAFVALLCVGVTVHGALSLGPDQADQNAYDKAPYCAAGTTDTSTCVLQTTASVGFVDVSKNTGKNAHGYTTTVDLDPTAGQSQTVTLSTSKDLSSSVHTGDEFPVLVWHDQITRYTYSGNTHDSDDNPHHLVAMDLGEVGVSLFIAALTGRPLIRRALRRRIAINLQRNRIPDWTLVTLVLATAFAAIVRASAVVTPLGFAGIGVLALSAAWPFVPWVATPSDTSRPYFVGPRTAAAMRNRNQARVGRLP